MYPREARTAMGAAFIRAAHLQVGHAPYVFEDYFAEALLEEDEKNDFREYFSGQYTSWLGQPWFPSIANSPVSDPFIGYMHTSPLVPEVLARQAYAEGFLTRLGSKCMQYVILGAGLDTFSFRSSNPGLLVYEVDRKEVSGFKMSRATSLRGAPGRAPVYVPMNLGADDLSDRLLNAGLKRHLPTEVSCLGLTPYLTATSLQETLSSLRGVMCESSIVVFDYTLPEALNANEGCPFTIELARRLEELGDPLQLELDTEAYRNVLGKAGFRVLEHLSPPDIQEKYFEGRRDGLLAAKYVCLFAAIAA